MRDDDLVAIIGARLRERRVTVRPEFRSWAKGRGALIRAALRGADVDLTEGLMDERASSLWVSSSWSFLTARRGGPRGSLLDVPKVKAQLVSLERRAGRTTDVIDHPRGQHDDLPGWETHMVKPAWTDEQIAAVGFTWCADVRDPKTGKRGVWLRPLGDAEGERILRGEIPFENAERAAERARQLRREAQTLSALTPHLPPLENPEVKKIRPGCSAVTRRQGHRYRGDTLVG